MKRRLTIIMLMLLALPLVLVACGGAATNVPEKTPAAVVTTAPAGGTTTTLTTTTSTTNTNTTVLTDTTPVSSTETTSGTGKVFTIVPEESKVSYSVNEVFLNEGVKYATAVGITQQVNGEVIFDPENPKNSSVGMITIDISAFKSDSDKRDNKIREQWLESTKYPIATFKPMGITGLPDTYTDGQEVTLQISGDLTVREVTTPVTFETTGKITGNEMVGKATTKIKMTDFGFSPPDIAGILKAENDVALTFEFVARAQ